MARSFRYPLKCMKCGLHFNVYSWNEEWTSNAPRYCPECGKPGAFPLGVEELDKEIYQNVSAI